MKKTSNYEKLAQALLYAKNVCAPDEYLLRQRTLLHTMCEYLLERDMPKELIEANKEKIENSDRLHKFMQDSSEAS